jgi:hypothetical protein
VDIKMYQSMWGSDLLRADTSSEDELLLTMPLIQENKIQTWQAAES